jgi:hypothetical protein
MSSSNRKPRANSQPYERLHLPPLVRPANVSDDCIELERKIIQGLEIVKHTDDEEIVQAFQVVALVLCCDLVLLSDPIKRGRVLKQMMRKFSSFVVGTKRAERAQDIISMEAFKEVNLDLEKTRLYFYLLGILDGSAVSTSSEERFVIRATALHLAMCWCLTALPPTMGSQIALQCVEQLPTIVSRLAAPGEAREKSPTIH